MNADEGVAPAVRSILDAARSRADPDGGHVDVDPQSLNAALSAAGADGRVPVIAEVKPTSPTTKGTREDDPVELAQAMVDGGAAALSVLTEPDHFGGSPEYLERVRDAVDVPVLRKDFILREPQLDAAEADVVLLIVRFVDDLEGLLAAARERGFQVLVEAHTEAEVREAVAAGAEFVGVNNRDLAKLDVDLGTFERVADATADVTEDITLIAESGVSTPGDVRRMRAAGADALLIGSAIMNYEEGEDPAATVRENTERLTTAESRDADDAESTGGDATPEKNL
ncbi:indole-3-glycerol phosphate synthase [Natranaeroarchaeum sulfidigenes]|uniref:Indole-3-glycerol phosphate synthase n=1 Tax=Natranaeroarchaeum sulfidigenes TaxID=2784880 RepID=A0A897MTF8_9EURY|nr:indole-3-glycerol phosphate synthase [Natranaeroarchaeum sulfidigenes]QSG03814.1 Indole-3-glycerol phosphate synthase [Natranaeroarchaeum sulfidigenes]